MTSIYIGSYCGLPVTKTFPHSNPTINTTTTATITTSTNTNVNNNQVINILFEYACIWGIRMNAFEFLPNLK